MNKFVRFFGKNRPTILTFVGIGGLIGTAVMAYKSASAVQVKLDTAWNLAVSEDPEKEDLTRKEKAWVYVKTLWPTFTLGAISTALIILGNSDHLARRQAAMAAYYISESTLKDYQAEVIKEIGEKSEHKIRDKVSEKHAKEVMTKEPAMIISDTEKPWVMDAETNSLFRYSYDKLNWIITQANLDMEEDRVDGISVWDLYDRLGIKSPPNEHWCFVGWNKKYKIDPYFTSTVTEIMGQMTPCMVMEYRVKPMFDYDAFG